MSLHLQIGGRHLSPYQTCNRCLAVVRSSLYHSKALGVAPRQQGHVVRVDGPPDGYDFRAEIMPETLEIVSALHPELLPIVERGNLVVYRRPADYVERRTDGYREPELIWLLGTAHVSATSVQEVTQVLQAVRPESVVVELCRSRAGLLATPEPPAPAVTAQFKRPQQQEEQQQRSGSAAVATASNSSSSSLDSIEEVSLPGSSGGSSGSQACDAALSTTTTATSSSSRGLPSDKVTSSTTTTTSNSSSSSSRSVSSDQVPSSSTTSSSSSSKSTNPWSLSGPSFFSAVARSASLGGQSSLLLRLLLARQAARAAEQLGTQGGAEFRAAAAAAEELGSQLVLGDRPVEITLERAWGALGGWQRVQLLWELGVGALAGVPQELTPELVEQVKSDDAITTLTAAMAATYPQLLAPLVHERDLYIAWSCKRSKAVNGTRQVVGVVGKGHLRGVVYALKHDSGTLRFADLVGGKNTRAAKQAAAAAVWRRVGVEVALGVGLAAAWQLYNSNQWADWVAGAGP